MDQKNIPLKDDRDKPAEKPPKNLIGVNHDQK